MKQRVILSDAKKQQRDRNSGNRLAKPQYVYGIDDPEKEEYERANQSMDQLHDNNSLLDQAYEDRKQTNSNSMMRKRSRPAMGRRGSVEMTDNSPNSLTPQPNPANEYRNDTENPK